MCYIPTTKSGQLHADLFLDFHRQNDCIDGLQSVFRKWRGRIHAILHLKRLRNTLNKLGLHLSQIFSL